MRGEKDLKNWAKILEDCQNANAELVNEIAELKAEMKEMLKDMEELDNTDKVLFSHRFSEFKKKWVKK